MEEEKVTALLEFDGSGQLTGILPGCNTDGELKVLQTALKELFHPATGVNLGSYPHRGSTGTRPTTHD